MDCPQSLKVGDWTIYRQPKPIPTRAFDWSYVHAEYDGPEDDRCGAAMSPFHCIAEIRELNHKARAAIAKARGQTE